MTAWRALAPAKVNFTLYVGRPRADGYHPLVSMVQALELADDLTLETGASEADADEVVCPGVEGDNLAARAIRAFRAATGWDGPPVRLTITKRIPVAAGMGGGSSDAAATLRLLAAASGRAVPDGLAASLGADVTSLLVPGRVLMEGVGERVRPLDGPRDRHAYVVVPDPEGLSTPAVYGEFDRLGLGREDLTGLSHDEPHNDLEPAAIALRPSIERTLAALREAGARHALVSGSGPTAVALFERPDEAHAAAKLLAGTVTTAVAGAGFGAPRRIS